MLNTLCWLLLRNTRRMSARPTPYNQVPGPNPDGGGAKVYLQLMPTLGGLQDKVWRGKAGGRRVLQLLSGHCNLEGYLAGVKHRRMALVATAGWRRKTFITISFAVRGGICSGWKWMILLCGGTQGPVWVTCLENSRGWQGL